MSIFFSFFTIVYDDGTVDDDPHHARYKDQNLSRN